MAWLFNHTEQLSFWNRFLEVRSRATSWVLKDCQLRNNLGPQSCEKAVLCAVLESGKHDTKMQDVWFWTFELLKSWICSLHAIPVWLFLTMPTVPTVYWLYLVVCACRIMQIGTPKRRRFPQKPKAWRNLPARATSELPLTSPFFLYPKERRHFLIKEKHPKYSSMTAVPIKLCVVIVKSIEGKRDDSVEYLK